MSMSSVYPRKDKTGKAAEEDAVRCTFVNDDVKNRELRAKFKYTNNWVSTSKYTIVRSQAIEDKKRHDADGIQNCRICHVLGSDGSIQDKPWQHVEVGDILFLKDKDEMPADVLILATSEEEGRCFVETCNLDGETNLK
ncbi:hypothetical protein B5M09_004370, partial [Aphanomyces astaci]